MSIETLLDRFQAVHDDKGRPAACGVRLWLQEQALVGRDPDEIRAEMIARSDWHPEFSLDALVKSAEFEDEERIARQSFYAAHLRDVGMRHLLERAVRDHGELVCREAFEILIEGLLACGHPNPKGLLLQVLDKVPAEIELTDLPAGLEDVFDPDGQLMPLSAIVVWGGRGAEPLTEAQEAKRLRAKLAVLQAQPTPALRAKDALAALRG